MNFEHHEDAMFRLWNSVRIARSSQFNLFTFGESTLPYFLVLDPEEQGQLVSLRQGTIRITRPTILTPGNSDLEFRNFDEDDDRSDDVVRFILARSAAFSHLKIDNQQRGEKSVSDSVEETIAKLTRMLDADEEEGTAILAAPQALGWMALMRYAAEQVLRSTPGNVQELRERGMLDF